MPTILITGASRGIGRELCAQYQTDGWDVIAACRNPADVDLGCESLALDVRDPGSVQALQRSLEGRPIDILWNNAGVFLGRNQSLSDLDYDEWAETMLINTLAPIRIAAALVDNVAASERRLMAFTTSRMGSIGENTGGGAYAYRSSKAALNMACKNLSLDLAARGIAVVVLHPGWVRTDMGGAQAAIDTATSVTGMRQTVDGLGVEATGRFLNYDGGELTW